MLREGVSKAFRKVLDLVFFDEVRLLELFSALNLLAWCKVLLTTPELLEVGAYRGFSGTEAIVWAYAFGAIGLAQLGAMLVRRFYPLELRFVALAFAAGAWTIIAWNFRVGDTITTANLNYSLLAGACAISGAFLAWKTSSFQS